MIIQGGCRIGLAIACAALIAGCGGGSPAASSAGRQSGSTAGSAPCRVGKSILPHVSEPPATWSEASAPPLALACSTTDAEGDAAIVGFPLAGEGSCVGPFSAEVPEGLGQLCSPRGQSWTVQCEARGCIHFFSNEPGSTVFDGPVDAAVKAIEVRVGGRHLDEGVLFAPVTGGLQRKIGAAEPFGFFFVLVPACVSPSRVRVRLVGSGGARLGPADAWDVPANSCRSGA